MSQENVGVVRSVLEAWNRGVAVHHHGRGRASGARVDMHGGQVVTLRGGKVVRWRLFGTIQEALQAAGLSE